MGRVRVAHDRHGPRLGEEAPVELGRPIEPLESPRGPLELNRFGLSVLHARTLANRDRVTVHSCGDCGRFTPRNAPWNRLPVDTPTGMVDNASSPLAPVTKLPGIAMSPSEFIVEITAANFEAEVIERSFKTPVVLDFWAPWCGPCKTLGPLLEAEAIARKGAFILAKLDTDANPELASAFQIQSIPTVMVLDQGRPVDGFQGALPKKELGEFLDRFGGTNTSPGLEEARALQKEGKLEEALALLEGQLEELADDEGALLLQTRLLVDLGRDDEAREYYDSLEDELQQSEEGRAIRARLDLKAGAGDLGALEAAFAKEPSSANRFALAKAQIAGGQHAAGLEHLLELVRSDRAFEDDAARKLMLETFEALGSEDPVTNEYRYELQMALFV